MATNDTFDIPRHHIPASSPMSEVDLHANNPEAAGPVSLLS